MRSRKPMVEQTKSWEVVFRDLQRAIISGENRPRERLVEDELIASTGATRHAIRRAFDELLRVGLVVRQPNKGVQVRDYSIREIEELYEIRECLELRAASHYTKPAGTELIDRLTAIASRHRDASREQRFADVFSLNNEFHELLYRAAGNQQLADAIIHYTFATHPIRTRAFPNEELREIAIRDHFAMVDAVAAGKGDELAELIRTHIQRPKEYYIRATNIQGSI
ncbi:DNA-binding GntR family transcriptional regulator [Rhizobium sp. BK313]|uniref:GntR family transcriptional regulator n=1 Tax=Rhizobium sp. BK313 TaxID=2587081 RepID=UPI0010D0BCA6|nr:GntR family transcriptional regulator [Rhizobium sp. BK313]MBB3458751.1 DNA-binding GntR family transcriptional regulator [Rhizobium sp. BK313]